MIFISLVSFFSIWTKRWSEQNQQSVWSWFKADEAHFNKSFHYEHKQYVNSNCRFVEKGERNQQAASLHQHNHRPCVHQIVSVENKMNWKRSFGSARMKLPKQYLIEMFNDLYICLCCPTNKIASILNLRFSLSGHSENSKIFKHIWWTDFYEEMTNHVESLKNPSSSSDEKQSEKKSYSL